MPWSRQERAVFCFPCFEDEPPISPDEAAGRARFVAESSRAWEELTFEEYRGRMQELAKEIRQEAKARHRANGTRPMGVKRLRQEYFDPFGELWFSIGGDWTYLEGVDQLVLESEDQNGNLVLTVIAGRETFIEFDGSRLTLYGKNGSMRSFAAVSGQLDEEGRTQPGLQRFQDRGPIPEGQYSFNPAIIQYFDDLSLHQKAFSLFKRGEWPGGPVAWGRQRVELSPVRPTNTYGRSGFFIHGGWVPGSAGCIDLLGRAGDFFSAVPDIGGDVSVFVHYP